MEDDIITFISASKDGRESVMVRAQASSLDEMMCAFERFLKGCGYHINGRVGAIEEIHIRADSKVQRQDRMS